MRKSAFIGVVLAISLVGTGALAQEGVAVSTDPMPGGGYSTMVIGGQLSLGMAHAVGDDEVIGDAKPKFGGGGFAYFDYYLSEMFAIEAGLGVVSKGYRISEEIMGTEVKARMSIAYLEIPLGVKLNVSNFRVAVLFALELGLAGKYKVKEPNDDEEDIDWDDDNIRRFNIAPKIGLGYAIPVGPITIVPGLDWSIHLLNDYDGPQDDEFAARSMNLMFNVAVEFGL